MNKPQSIERPPYEEYVGYLRSALHYLYDPVHLRRSPLVDLFEQEAAPDRAAALQRILTDTIRILKPDENEPPQSTAWRIYDVLSLQYIRQFTREVVANQLGISERQLRREQRLAIEALAQRLWQKYHLDDLPESAHGPGLTSTLEKAQALSTELGWLNNPETDELATLEEILNTVKGLIQPLAEQRAVPLYFNIETGIEETPAPTIAIRSILLTVLNTVIPKVTGGTVGVDLKRSGPDILIEVTCEPFSASKSGTDSIEEVAEIGLDAAQQLAVFYNAILEVKQVGQVFNVLLSFPVPEQIPVLVVDDNADWLEMLKRYVVGSRYRVIPVREPRSALSLAEKVQPALILLDVMMPNVDGWQVLSELRQSPTAHRIPVVVCTILPLADLALSLSVNAFLQKPVTQDQFLDILDRLAIKTDH